MKYDAFEISIIGESLKNTIIGWHNFKEIEIDVITSQDEKYLDIHLHIKKLKPTFLEKLKDLIAEHEKNDI